MSPQAQTVAMPQRFPLVQQLYTRSPNTPITQDARLVNCYAEKDPQDGEYWIYKRVGVGATAFFNRPTGYPGGLYYYQSSLATISVAGGIVYIDDIPLSGGTLVSGVQCWFETINSSPQTVVVMSPQGALIITPSTQSVTPIVDVNYPTIAVPGWAYLDGTLYVMDPSGNIWGTAGFNNAAVWSGLNVIQASARADNGVFLATQLSYVVAFKQWTTQIFYDNANPPPGSPLSPVPDAQIPFGCLHANTVQKIDEILIWVTSNQTISPQVILMENLSPKIISVPSIDRILDNILINVAGQVIPLPPPRPPLPPDNALFSFSFKHGGHRFYGLTMVALNLTLVYDIDQGLWYVWTDANYNYWPFINFSYTAPTQVNTGLHLAQMLPPYPGTFSPGVPGNVYIVDGDYEYPNDLGQVFPVDIYTPNFSAGTDRRKVLNMLYFTADQTPGSILQARYSDNDYKSWSNFRRIELNFERPYLGQEGTFTRRAYHLRHRCNTKFRIKSAGLQMDIGTL